jgi:hypothetical protein
MRASTKTSLSTIAHSGRAALISVCRSAARSPQRQREQTTTNSIGLNGSGSRNAEVVRDERDVWNAVLYHRAIQKRIGEALLARHDLSQPLPDETHTPSSI